MIIILEGGFVELAKFYVPGQAPKAPIQEEESKDSFLPSEAYVTETLAKIKKNPIGEVNYTLNTDDVLSPQPHNPDFECGICLNIVN